MNEDDKKAMENAVRKWNERAGHTAIQHALECSQREGMMLRNLLSVIHCDGGQHAKAMGIEQACTDAEKFVVEMISALDCVKNIDALIEQATLAEREACALTCVKLTARQMRKAFRTSLPGKSAPGESDDAGRSRRDAV